MKIQILFFAFIFTSLIAQPKEFKVYYLGGQSNMEGLGYNKDLPEELNREIDNVWIFGGSPTNDNEPVNGIGKWVKLKPGFGYKFNSDGKKNNYSDMFGPELSFGKRIAELSEGENIAIIKYAKSGSSIEIDSARFGCWDPDFVAGNGVNQYDHFLNCLKLAFADRDIDNDGYEDKLIPAGIIWMQGESDAYYSIEIAQNYEAQLRRLMNLFRAALRVDDLPVVVGMITDSGQDEDGKMMNYYEYVANGQKNFAASDPNASIVTATENYNYMDKWHYDSAGFIALGKKFAEAVYELEKDKK